MLARWEGYNPIIYGSYSVGEIKSMAFKEMYHFEEKMEWASNHSILLIKSSKREAKGCFCHLKPH